MITLYGISNCDTCRKAKKWLEKNNICFTFFDFRKSDLSIELIQRWVNDKGIDSLINRRGTTWRNLSKELKEKLVGSNSVEVLMDSPTLMKRPIIEINDRLLIGFETYKMENIILIET